MSLNFETLTKDEYTEYIQHSPENILQAIEMAELKSSRGMTIFYVGVKDAEGTIIYGSILTKTKIRLGYAFDIDGLVPQPVEIMHVFIDGLKKFVLEQGGIYVTISPNEYSQSVTNSGVKHELETPTKQLLLEADFTCVDTLEEFNKNGNPNWIYVKDLREVAEQDLASTYSKNAIVSIDKAKKFGISLRAIDYEELPLFKEITEETSQRIGYQDKPLDYYELVYKIYGEHAKFMVAELNFPTYLASLEKERSKIQEKLEEVEEALKKFPKSKKKNNQKKEFSSEKDAYTTRIDKAMKLMEGEESETVIIACALFLLTPHETVYLFSGTLDKYKNIDASFLIQDYMIRYSIQQTIPWYNFYGIQGVFDGSDGVLTFKQSFNGTAYQKVGTYELRLNTLKSKLYYKLKSIVG